MGNRCPCIGSSIWGGVRGVFYHTYNREFFAIKKHLFTQWGGIGKYPTGKRFAEDNYWLYSFLFFW